MAITILVSDDRNLTAREVDDYTAELADFVSDELESVLTGTSLDRYLVDALCNAKVFQPDRMRPEQPDNINLLAELEANGRSCLACKHHSELLRFLTCVGTHDAYYGLRWLMDLHDLDCWTTTFLST